MQQRLHGYEILICRPTKVSADGFSPKISNLQAFSLLPLSLYSRLFRSNFLLGISASNFKSVNNISYFEEMSLEKKMLMPDNCQDRDPDNVL